METIVKNVVSVAKSKHPKSIPNDVLYGTGGFRLRAEKLDYIMYRMGILAVLRSKLKKAACGVMITASHNPACDNGVKIVDPLGEMLEISWESYATKIANCSDEDLGNTISDIASDENIDITQDSLVFLGMDTRPSSVELSQACKDGIAATEGKYKDYGVLTTPQLHYMVWSHNTGSCHPPTQEGYYLKMANAYKQLVELSSPEPNRNLEVTADGANGVGAIKARELSAYLQGVVDIKAVFDGSSGILNYQCGSDHVKTTQSAPVGLEMTPMSRYASFDGDADRLVYYYKLDDGVFHLLDGDKIAILTAGYIKELLTTSCLPDVTIGLVQTAYANGASTKYITETLAVPVTCTKTGVKYLHHAAQEYDVGVYFEANGHGTVIFSDKAQKVISQAASGADASSPSGNAVLKLSALVTLINQAVGDAISDMLMVEAVLMDKRMSLADWGAQYTDLPNVLMKVKIADRQVIKTTDAERRTTSPAGLQTAIDELVNRFPGSRSFVRPSGTEDIVRVYAEADKPENAKELALQVCRAVYNLCGGVGDSP